MLTTLAVAPDAAAQWPREFPPRPLAPRPVTFPPFEVKKLANGLTVVLVSQNEQPSVSVRMIVRAGAAHDPKAKMGLAMLTATLLDQGAGDRNAEQIADDIDYVGGILSTGAGTDLSYVNTVVMKDDYAAGLAMMADVVRRPTFAAGGDRAPAAAGAVGAEGGRRGSGVGGRHGHRSADLRLPPLRHARLGHRRSRCSR